MFCVSCGKQLDDQSEFCRYCGASQTDDTKAVVAAAGAQIAKAARAEFKGLRVGERVIAVGAVVAALSFFLPWAKMPEQAGSLLSLFGGGQATTSVSGVGLMKLFGGVVFLLVLPVLSLFLLYSSRSANPGRKLLLAGFQVWIGAQVGPQAIISILFVPLATNVLAAGAWGIGLGYSAILAGALILLGDLGRQNRA